MTSTIKSKVRKITIGIIWLILWQIIANIINEEILLPSPLLVFRKFVELASTKEFYQIIALSTGKILLGFIFSIFVGILLAYISFKSKIFYEFIKPIMQIFKSIPLASFVILLLFWVNKKYLSIYISFIMATPIIFQNALTGLFSIDYKLIEMAQVLEVEEIKRVKYIYKVKTKPYLSSSIISVSGLVFKAGIAGEVIGLSENSIGNMLYNSKVYLDMPALFAWTLAILIISMSFEAIVKKILVDNND